MIEVITNVAINTGGFVRTHHYGDHMEENDTHLILFRTESVEVEKSRTVEKIIFITNPEDPEGEPIEETIEEQETYYECESVNVIYHTFSLDQIDTINTL